MIRTCRPMLRSLNPPVSYSLSLVCNCLDFTGFTSYSYTEIFHLPEGSANAPAQQTVIFLINDLVTLADGFFQPLPV